MQKAETKFKKKVQDYLKTIPNLWQLKVYGNAVQSGGIPDILICYKGRFIALELKDPDEKNTYGATRRQKAHITRINKCGGIGCVVDSLDQVKEIINKISREQ